MEQPSCRAEDWLRSHRHCRRHRRRRFARTPAILGFVLFEEGAEADKNIGRLYLIQTVAGVDDDGSAPDVLAGKVAVFPIENDHQVIELKFDHISILTTGSSIYVPDIVFDSLGSLSGSKNPEGTNWDLHISGVSNTQDVLTARGRIYTIG